MSKPLTITEAKMAYYPDLDSTRAAVGAEMANNIPTTNGFKLVSQKFVDTTGKVLAPLDAFTKQIELPIIMSHPKAKPVVSVPVISGVGDVLTNPTDWSGTNLTSSWVDVTLQLKAVTFALTEYDLMNGNKVENYTGAAINRLAQDCVASAMAAIKAADTDSVIATAGAEVGPEFIAKQVSTIFGDSGMVDSLLVSTAQYGNIIPTNALALNPKAEGVYGIGRIFPTAFVTQAGQTGETLAAVALKNDAVVMAASIPSYRSNGLFQVVEFVDNEFGIPMVMTSYFNPEDRTYHNSVETLIGFAVSDSSRIATVNMTSAPSA